MYFYFITIGSWLEPTVIAPNHCRLLVRTGSDKWPPTHCRCKPQTNSDVVLHYRFNPSPNHFLIFKLRTGSEGISLPVLTNPTVMRPAVISESVVVNVGFNLHEQTCVFTLAGTAVSATAAYETTVGHLLHVCI